MSSNTSATGSVPPRVLLFIFAGYLALVAVVVVVMFLLRQSVLANLETPQAQSDWNKWRIEASTQDGTHGPVQRSAPRSTQPPALVLMRDYFGAILVGLLLPVSALYGFIAWIACGVVYQQPTATHFPSETRSR
jgi:hypothetical protein